MSYRLIVVILITLVALVSPVLANAADMPSGKLRAFVSILPIAYFAERVGGSNVEVGVLVGAGQDPHTFEPTPKLVSKLADSRVLFAMQFPFESTLLKKIGSTFKGVEVVDLQQGIKLRAITEEEEHSHGKHAEHNHGRGKKYNSADGPKDSHEKGEDHGHKHDAGELDQHTWLDPQLAKIQAKTIADTFIRIDPARQADYEKNLKEFHTDLDDVHERLKTALSPVKGKKFYVFHPAYGYFGDAYGLKQVAVQLDGKEPTAKQLARLIGLAKEDGVRVIFAQPQFSRKTVDTLAKSVGGAVVVLDDLAPDYVRNLREMAGRLEAALQGQKESSPAPIGGK